MSSFAPSSLPLVAMPPVSHSQLTTHGHIDPPHTPVANPPPPYTRESSSDVSHDLEAGIGAKVTGKQTVVQRRYSCGSFLTDIWSLFTSLTFIALVYTILIFLFSTTLTDIGARLLSWDHHDEFLVLLTWQYTLAAVAIGSAILGSILAFILVLLGMNAPHSFMDAPPSIILPPCALGSVFALPMGLAAFPRGVAHDLPFTWKDALSASASGVLGFCVFVLICMFALLAATMLMGSLPQRRLSSYATDVRSDSSRYPV